MSNTLALLMKPDDWGVYKHKSLAAKDLSADQVIWGRGPTNFPCLVAGFIMDVDKSPGSMFVCCYVYVEQAMDLIKAAGITGVESSSRIMNVVGPEQTQFNETVLAHLATVINILVRTSLTKEDQYTKIFVHELQVLEQKHGQEMDELLASVKRGLKGDVLEDS